MRACKLHNPSPFVCSHYLLPLSVFNFIFMVFLQSSNPKIACRVVCQSLQPRPCVTFPETFFFLLRVVVRLAANPWGGGSTTSVDCPRLLMQRIRRYPPYLQAVSSIRNLRTRHAVLTRANRLALLSYRVFRSPHKRIPGYCLNIELDSFFSD
jgi:hypothetical protein